MQEAKKDEINYESIIAGVLVRFEVIDMMDFSLIMEDFEKKRKVDICGVWSNREHIAKYVTCEKNGMISLKKGITLDSFIEEGKTLRERLSEVAGNIVMDYVNCLDIEKYKLEKENALLENKEKVLKEANVLLISDIQDDYDELIKYGFKNVDYFKSIIRADCYFANHPKELEKYHLIVTGNQSVQRCCFEGNVALEEAIYPLKDKSSILVLALYRYDYPTHVSLSTCLSDRKNYRSFHPEELTYQGIYDRMVENMFINHIMEKADLKNKKFIPIEDKINPNRLPFPTKKSDLKILYLNTARVPELETRISEELKLNITFKEDNNCGLGRYVKNYLGDYDIIITSNLYSRNLLGMNFESTEQCKDTGRELTLLASYEEDYLNVDRDLGDRVKLNYRFGGNIAPNSDFHSKEFRVLRQQIETEDQEEYWRKYHQSVYSQMRAIIEALVHFYNEALIQMKKSSIRDLDFKTADEVEREYTLEMEKERKRKEIELAPIKLFDNIRYSITSYLNYRKAGFITKVPEGLKITEGKDGIKVENIYQDRTLCTIVFSKDYKQDDLRIFEMQTLSKKGTLSSPQMIGVYTSKYEDLKGIPNRPDERQESALISIEKKIHVVLNSLNEEAWKKQLEQETQESKILHLKGENKKRKKYQNMYYNGGKK